MHTKNIIKLITISFLGTHFTYAEPLHGINRGAIISDDNQTIIYNNSEEVRTIPFGNSMEPLLGYIRGNGEGTLGIEESMNDTLMQGEDVHLSVNLALQQKIEKLLDESKEKYDADDIIAAVMESDSGKVLTMASSNRYDPTYIRRKDWNSMYPKFTAYPYEPGVMMMPFVIATAMDKGLVDTKTELNGYNGKFELRESVFLRDNPQLNTVNMRDIIVHTSHIGIVQVAWLLSGYALYHGFEKFGFAKPSGIELSRDKAGIFRLADDLEDKTRRATTSYGYGMVATFTQFMKAYSAFNNAGIPTTPKLILDTEDKEEDRTPAMKVKTAEVMHDILVDNMHHYSIHNALEVGGQLSTAHIYKHGKYVQEFHGSFYGFVNDNVGHKYTIGVLVVSAKAKKKYYASQSALPVFSEMVDMLVNGGFLLP